MKIKIRMVNLEFLRAGPPHNQLLSPLTQYLGICGESGAGVVTVPYEHGSFLRRLKDLRYDSGDADQRRLDVLQQTGVDIARVLGSVPGFEGSLKSNSETLIHLRLVLSASELALLPFELSKMPHGNEYPSDNWLALQTQAALCMTRHIRSVPSDDVRWWKPPRILFITGDTQDIPFEEHRAALEESIRPWDRRRPSDRITLRILENASIADVRRACSEDCYTHIHVLAHGDLQPNDQEKYGICLGDKVIPGDQFAKAIESLTDDGVHRPTVVTVASCDSGQVGSVISRGASFAHELHQSGIPLVVASQFPLSKEGSVVMARSLYRDLLWGKNPLHSLHKLRTELYSLHSGNYHDWASLVVYESLPKDMEEQLQEFSYRQARSAVDAALERMDASLDEALQRDSESHLNELARSELVATVEETRRKLPDDGPFATECLGLLASSAKRLADAAFDAARWPQATPDDRYRRHSSCYRYLEQSAAHYTEASRHILSDVGKQVHRIATLHWVVVQKLSLDAVLGKPLSDEYWWTGKLAADLFLNHPDPDERAWAHGSLAELWLLKLGSPGTDTSTRTLCAEKARAHAGQVLDSSRDRGRFTVTSTRRQFQRYIEWWGLPEFDDAMKPFGVPSKKNWRRAQGLVDAAQEICELLAPRGQLDTLPPVAATVRVVDARVAPSDTATLARSNSARSNRKEEAYFSVEMLPARNGDCLWIEFGDEKKPTRILIDCGVQSAYSALRSRIDQLPKAQRQFELFVLTHIDSDHIGGAIPFLADSSPEMIKEVWFNGWQQIKPYFLGAKQGEIFSTLLRDGKFNWNPRTDGKAIVTNEKTLPSWKVGEMTLTLLSPTADTLGALSKLWDKEIRKLELTPGSTDDFQQFLRSPPTKSTDVPVLANARFHPDTGKPNGSSIAFLAEYAGKAVLFGADAHAPVLVASIRKLLAQRKLKTLKLDALKLPHHGSTKNLNIELLKLIDCPRYLVSSDGSTFHHPDREAIARVIEYGGKQPTLYFNYLSEYNDVWARNDLQARYGYTTVYPRPGQAGLPVYL